ncbi:HEAT repeat domain-containing protein [Breznakiella homolactica]|uniref:HEAT repeat domain-containing protein n=1 Tax=Breznakiella homolactica TaxID=2798577 RepID=A0A7T7XKT3_9SPIR|nr:HEAT repeat domain-containing protein [Breznakiella homolactica]QQO08140.1 HEAT repeat domain-containing protein [Breznakiella homolactica]
MVIVKRCIAVTVILLTGISAVMAQSSNNQREMSVEESYLQQSVELMVIREQSRAESRDMKMIALEYIGDAIGRGNTGTEVKEALEYMALEGVMNKARENGRVVNNYPDVRAKAAMYLGELGTVEAKDALIKVVLADPEPMVLTEAVKSLAKIGLNDNDETVNAISWVVTRFDVLNPDNLLALSALEAFEILAEKNGGLKDPSAIRTIIRIADGPYIRPVQQRARALLGDLRQYSGSSDSNSQNSQNSARQ